MIDREMYQAEELDGYVEAHQAGQVSKHPPDLPVTEWHLADMLLEMSAIAQPDAQFLAKLENQIHQISRKPAEGAG